MSLTNFPNGITSFGQPVTPKYWLSNGAEAFFVGSVDASDNNAGTDYDRPLQRISKATVDKVQSSAGAASGAGDIVYVSAGRYTENVRVMDRDYVRIIGAGIGATTLVPGDTASTQNTDALGQSQTITFLNETTNQTDWGFIIGSRGIVVTGFTVLCTGNAAGATGAFYIGDGRRISASNNWGSSQFHIYGNNIDGDDTTNGGWACLWDGFGPGGLMEWNTIYRMRSGGLMVTSGQSRLTLGGTFRFNQVIACRGFGIRRNPNYTGGNCAYIHNWIHDDGGSALTNGILLGTIDTGLGDLVAENSIGTTNASISVSDAQDRISGNMNSTAGSAAVTYVSMA